MLFRGSPGSRPGREAFTCLANVLAPSRTAGGAAGGGWFRGNVSGGFIVLFEGCLTTFGICKIPLTVGIMLYFFSRLSKSKSRGG